MKIIISFASTVVLISLGVLNFELLGTDLNTRFFQLGMVALVSEVVVIISYVILNRKRIGLITHCWWLALWRQKIRFSMSYLYRIKVNDKYLLVKNSNFGHYQHVGGKYKKLDIAKSILEKNIKASDDIKLSTSGIMKDDFAIFVPAKNAIKFIDWFNTHKDREISHWREFYEELIGNDNNVLSKELFPYVNYNFVGTVITPIKTTPGWGGCKEILQYDILDLLPTYEQESELKLLQSNGDTDYLKWADTELIDNLGHDNRSRTQIYPIGSHTKWALNMKWEKE